MNLTALTQKLTLAKASESAAKADRLKIEALILNEVGDLKAEGTTHIENLKFVTGFNRSWDNEKLAEAQQNIKSEFFPFSQVFKEDTKACKAIQQANPDLFDQFSGALTLKPKKTTISIKEAA